MIISFFDLRQLTWKFENILLFITIIHQFLDTSVHNLFGSQTQTFNKILLLFTNSISSDNSHVAVFSKIIKQVKLVKQDAIVLISWPEAFALQDSSSSNSSLFLWLCPYPLCDVLIPSCKGLQMEHSQLRPDVPPSCSHLWLSQWDLLLLKAEMFDYRSFVHSCDPIFCASSSYSSCTKYKARCGKLN